MIRWHSNRRHVTAIGLALVTVLVCVVAAAWIRRTAPPWPTATGIPYQIPLLADGCPVIADTYDFVDAPGDLVPANPTEVVFCAIPTSGHVPRPGVPEPPRQRVLRVGAAEFATWLNRLPDRNAAWERWQRELSGWWPDAPPDGPVGEVCPMIGYSHDHAFVLRYADRPPVPVVATCGRGFFSSGTRTRVDGRPWAADEFLRLFAQQ